MIDTSIRCLRMGLVLIGFLLLIGSVFLPFQTHCNWNSTESGTIDYWVYSYESLAYWGRLFFVLIIFLSGYFRRGYRLQGIALYFFITFPAFPVFFGSFHGKSLCSTIRNRSGTEFNRFSDGSCGNFHLDLQGRRIEFALKMRKK